MNVFEWSANPRLRMVDLSESEVVEVSRDDTGKVWVNVDGVCVCRIGRTVHLRVEDELDA